MLTQKDFDQIEVLLDERLEEKLTEKIGGLPTKVEFYDKMDEMMGELKAIREEQNTASGKLSEHSDQIENHEGRITIPYEVTRYGTLGILQVLNSSN